MIAQQLVNGLVTGMRKIEDLEGAENQGKSECKQRVHRTGDKSVDKLLGDHA